MKRLPAQLACLSIFALFCQANAADALVRKEKLQIVFLFGQSNMVGLADPMTAWYLTQPAWVPPREVAMSKPETLDWRSLYWQGVQNFEGPQELKDQLQALYKERGKSRSLWRGRINDKKNAWQEEQWGPKPKDARDSIYEFLDGKAIEEGIYARMAAILDNPLNEFPQEKLYQQILDRDKKNAEHIERVREIYLKGTRGEDFTAFEAALQEAKIPKKPKGDIEALRATYAALAKKHVNLPIAGRTHIAGYGAITGSVGEGIQSSTQGPLSIGYGGGLTNIGPEYGVGITLERLVDAPILLVKCAWGNTTLKNAWRPGSLDGVETPIEKAVREAWNREETKRAEQNGREPKLLPPPAKTGGPGWSWTMALPHVRKVLADPGKYHPDYDPKLGYDLAGMVWFQGYSDTKNEAYGEQLVEMIKWFRKEVDAPKMPVVCGSMGVGAYDHKVFEGNVNRGMLYAANSPELKGGVDVVNTGRYYPLELDLLYDAISKLTKGEPEYDKLKRIQSGAISNKSYHYHGSAKFFLLAGDAMARSLAGLMGGGQASIHDLK
jgi:hypothetical protein